MSENTIKQIKNAEAEAQKRIALAKDQVEASAVKAEQDGEKTLSEAENQVTIEISQVLEQAKKDINNIKIKNERNRASQSQEIANIDNKAIDKAAEMVIKNIKDKI